MKKRTFPLIQMIWSRTASLVCALEDSQNREKVKMTVCSLTCRPNSRCRRPCLGGGDGCPLQSRSGGAVPSWWNTFSSAKHSVSIICRTQYVETSGRTFGLCLRVCIPHLVLPGNGDAACRHFAVERLVFGIQLHSFHRGELLNVQHVFAVNGLRLQHARAHRMLTLQLSQVRLKKCYKNREEED